MPPRWVLVIKVKLVTTIFIHQDLGCDIVLDMATLTGAQGISTGKYHAMHLSNADNWEKAVSEAGRVSGDLSFPGVREKQI